MLAPHKHTLRIHSDTIEAKLLRAGCKKLAFTGPLYSFDQDLLFIFPQALANFYGNGKRARHFFAPARVALLSGVKHLTIDKKEWRIVVKEGKTSFFTYSEQLGFRHIGSKCIQTSDVRTTCYNAEKGTLFFAPDPTVIPSLFSTKKLALPTRPVSLADATPQDLAQHYFPWREISGYGFPFRQLGFENQYSFARNLRNLFSRLAALYN